MGRRGPWPNPLSGRTARRLNSLAGRGPVMPASIGPVKMPAWLSPVAKKFWRENAPRLEAVGRLTALDAVAFAALADAWSHVVDAAAIVGRDGPMVTGPRGKISANPAIKILFAWQKTYLDLARDFGMTPSSRKRFGFVEADLADDPAEEFFGNVRRLAGKRDPAPDRPGVGIVKPETDDQDPAG